MNTITVFNAVRAPRLYAGLVLAAMLFAGVAHADTLYRSLDVGMSGADVTALQTFLTADRTLYPQGLITGYYGFLTKAAVSNFQNRNGISPVGRVGPITLSVLNAQMGGAPVGGAGAAPIISTVQVNAGTNTATVNWYTNEAAKGVVYYSQTPLVAYERINAVDVSGNTAMTDNAFRTTQAVGLSGLQANTTYYYLIYTTDQDGNVSVTWPNSFRTAN